MRKVLVSIIWIAFLEVVFYMSYIGLLIYFNPNITEAESYEYGRKFGSYIILTPIAIVIFAAVNNKLPGAKTRTTESET